MKLPRFTVRRLMIAVAIVGVLSEAVVECRRRRDRFKSLVVSHLGAYRLAVPKPLCENYGESAMDRERQGRLAEYHAQLIEKYNRAFRYPWLPVAPDPPEPE